MEVFLRYVGDPGFQTGVRKDMGIHQSTVSRTFATVVEAIIIIIIINNICLAHNTQSFEALYKQN